MFEQWPSPETPPALGKDRELAQPSAPPATSQSNGR